MTDKITRTMLENMTAQLNRRLGRPAEGWCRVDNRNVSQVGHFNLDYVAEYGGYHLEEHAAGGGVNQPFGSNRLNAREMYAVLRALHGALDFDVFKSVYEHAHQD